MTLPEEALGDHGIRLPVGLRAKALSGSVLIVILIMASAVALVGGGLRASLVKLACPSRRPFWMSWQNARHSLDACADY